MIELVQGNLYHCRVAQDLLYQYMVERKVDVALISDPYRKGLEKTGWYADSGSGGAAIYVPSQRVTVAGLVRDPEFISARINGVQIINCYASPNKPVADFLNLLQRIENCARATTLGIPILIAGDFNARSAAWGDWVENKRGEELCAMLESLELVIANSGSTLTFDRGSGSIVDVTAVSESLIQRISDWRVMESEFNNSDHHYIRFSIHEGKPRDTTHFPVHPGWNTKKIDVESFILGLQLHE